MLYEIFYMNKYCNIIVILLNKYQLNIKKYSDIIIGTLESYMWLRKIVRYIRRDVTNLRSYWKFSDKNKNKSRIVLMDFMINGNIGAIRLAITECLFLFVNCRFLNRKWLSFCMFLQMFLKRSVFCLYVLNLNFLLYFWSYF